MTGKKHWRWQGEVTGHDRDVTQEVSGGKYQRKLKREMTKEVSEEK